ncbi:MAG: hypothetical protein U1F83_00180 [Verrucomicrobiota bacterium]
MKNPLALAAIVGLLAQPVFGQGSAVMIKNRAKEVVNQNNVRQGVPLPSQTTPPPTPVPATPATPVVPQAQSLAKIKTDIAGFKTGSSGTAEQKQQFIKDLATAARSAKPSLPTVTTFVEALMAGLSEATLTPEQQGRLAQNIEAVLNSKPLAASQFEAIIADVQAIMQVGSLKRTTAAAIANDLKAVGAEVRR